MPDTPLQPQQSSEPVSPEPVASRIPKHLLLAAARRIVAQNSESEIAARRLIANAQDHSIDLSQFFGVIDKVPGAHGKPPQERIRQVCLFVRGPGRTVATFLSEPPRTGEIGTALDATADRIACLLTACHSIKQQFGDQVHVAQALPDPSEAWARDAFGGAGFLEVGLLSYLRRPFRSQAGITPPLTNTHCTLLNVAEIPESQRREVLAAALEASYEETLDCPKLCGLRPTADIMDSHLATGEFLPELWWVVLVQGRPVGCVLFSPIAGQRSVELVYLGIGTELRGKGLSKALLSAGIESVRAHPLLRNGFEEFTCAVDVNNGPAIRLYQQAGFSGFADRVALVKTL